MLTKGKADKLIEIFVTIDDFLKEYKHLLNQPTDDSFPKVT